MCENANALVIASWFFLGASQYYSLQIIFYFVILVRYLKMFDSSYEFKSICRYVQLKSKDSAVS
jgi:hypothetical protein